MKLFNPSFAAFNIWSLGSAVAHPHEIVSRQNADSFAGVNSFFLHAFQQNDRIQVLDAIKAADLKLLRIFISYTVADNKGTGSVEMPDIEPVQVGTWDDTQLEAIDQLMVEAQERDIKLVIAMHDRYQLGCWGNDTYVTKYHLPAVDCNTAQASANDVRWWYTDPSPIGDFENRMKHILEHSNTLLPGSPQWKDLSDHIYAFNLENEGQGHINGNIAPYPEWWCDRANFARGLMGSSEVLVSTGGGNEFSNSDISQNWECDALDIVDIHSYSGVQGWKDNGPIAVQHAVDSDKMVIFEEFGATGDGKADQIKQHIDVFNGLGVPWMPWEISNPGKGAADFEFWTDEETYNIVASGAKTAGETEAKVPIQAPN